MQAPAVKTIQPALIDPYGIFVIALLRPNSPFPFLFRRESARLKLFRQVFKYQRWISAFVVESLILWMNELR
ncbi:hypothetical protein KRR40_37200 [Niabella defluvii]|nr:hypothetical protein KRR40_37200 [Niabella sp. I65]